MPDKIKPRFYSGTPCDQQDLYGPHVHPISLTTLKKREPMERMSTIRSKNMMASEGIKGCGE